MGTIARGAKAGGGTNLNSGQTADPAEVNTDFNAIVTEINGNLDDANIETATIPGGKALRFTEMAAPGSPSSNDVLAYVVDPDTVTFKQSGGLTLSLPIGDGGVGEILAGPFIQTFDTTERTTNATSTADLSAHTVNIPAGDAFIITGLVRKTTGHASGALLGFKINAVQIYTNFAMTGTTNAAENGHFTFGIGSGLFGSGRDTNYIQAGAWTVCVAGVLYTTLAPAANLPTAAITSIVITGHVTNALNTLAIKNVTVYRIARS